jgi:hypothetical protein
MQHGDYDEKQELLKVEGDLKQQFSKYPELNNLPAISSSDDTDDEAF